MCWCMGEKKVYKYQIPKAEESLLQSAFLKCNVSLFLSQFFSNYHRNTTNKNNKETRKI